MHMSDCGTSDRFGLGKLLECSNYAGKEEKRSTILDEMGRATNNSSMMAVCHNYTTLNRLDLLKKAADKIVDEIASLLDLCTPRTL
jgi:hypothetical protein